MDLNAALVWWAMWACLLVVGLPVVALVIYAEWRRWME
jgi:hypothetical protein